MIELINIGNKIRWDIESYIKIIRFYSKETQQEFQKSAREAYRYYKKNTQYLTFYLENISDIIFLSSLNFKNLAIRVDMKNDKDIKFLKDCKEQLKSFDSVEVMLVKNIKYLGYIKEILNISKNIIIRFDIDFFKSINENDLKNLYNSIVFDIDIVLRVYPFASILRFLYIYQTNKAIKRTLWRFFQEERGLFYYVTDNKKITLSKRFVDKNLFFGTIDDDIKQLKQSSFYKSLFDIEKDIFFKYDKCSMCDMFFICNAYLKYEDIDYDCSSILNILRTFKSDFKDINALQKVEV